MARCGKRRARGGLGSEVPSYVASRLAVGGIHSTDARKGSPRPTRARARRRTPVAAQPVAPRRHPPPSDRRAGHAQAPLPPSTGRSTQRSHLVAAQSRIVARRGGGTRNSPPATAERCPTNVTSRRGRGRGRPADQSPWSATGRACRRRSFREARFCRDPWLVAVPTVKTSLLTPKNDHRAEGTPYKKARTAAHCRACVHPSLALRRAAKHARRQ